MNFIDQIIIIILMLLTLVIGFNKNSDDKLKITSSFTLFLTIFATSLGSGSSIGLFDKLYQGKINYLIAFIVSLFWILYINRDILGRIKSFKNCYSIGDIFYSVYGSDIKRLVGIFAFLFSMAHMAVQVSACSFLIDKVFHLNEIYVKFLIFSIMLIYTSIGGLRAVIMTDQVQGIFIILGIIILLWGVLTNNNNFEFTPNLAWSFNAYEAIILSITFIIMTFYPPFIQRILIAKDIDLVKKSMNYNFVAYMGYTLTIALIVYLVRGNNSLVSDNKILLEVINLYLPTGLKAIVIFSLISAILSTADSDLECAMDTLLRDVVQKDFKKTYLQLITLIIGLINILISLKFKNLLDYIIFVSGLWTPIIFIPFLMVIFKVELPKKILYISITLSSLSFLYSDIFIKSSIPSVLIATSVSLFTIGFYKLLEEE